MDKTPISSLWEHDDRYYKFQRVSGLPISYFRTWRMSYRAGLFWAAVGCWAVAVVILLVMA